MKNKQKRLKDGSMDIDLDLKINMPNRTTKYTSRTIGRTRAFIKKCVDEGRTPFAEELALELGVSGRTINNWANDEHKQDFGEIYQILKTVQKLDIKKKALLGLYENPIAKLILSAEHNVVERQKKEVTGEDGGAIKVERAMTPEDREIYSDEITKLFEKINSK